MQTNRDFKLVAVSGGFDPIHPGHIALMQEAKKLGDKLAVIVNDDDFLMRKKGYVFMKLEDRVKVIEALGCVDMVYPAIDKDNTVCQSLEALQPDIFANGGDRHASNIPEYDVCRILGIEMVFNVGGGKQNSSSELVKRFKEVDNDNEK